MRRAARAAVGLAAWLLVGCPRTPESRPYPAAAPTLAQSSAPTPARSAAPEVTAPPLVLEHGEEFRKHPSGAKLSVFARGMLGASFTPDKSHVLLVPGGRGAQIRTLPKGGTITLRAGDVTRSAFSPDSQLVALEEEAGSIRTFHVATGAIGPVVDGVRPEFIGPTRLGFRHGCDAFTIDLSPPGPVRKLGSACGELLHASPTYETWIVSEQARFRRGVLQAYAAIRRVHLPSGKDSVLLRAPPDGGLYEPRVSPKGDRLCVLDDVFALACTTLGAGVVLQQIWPSNVLRDPVFDDTGSRLLFGVGPSEHAPRDVYMADLARGKLRKLVHASHEWWDFLPGGERIIGHGGDEKLTVFDLKTGLAIELGNPHEEWEGLTIVPGDATQFLIGRERGGGRDLWLVTLPS